MENLKKTIGKNISILRKRKKLTQSEFANELHYSDKAISKWENGDSMPDIETLYNVAQYFGVSMDCLVSEDLESEGNKFLLPKENLSNKLIITLLSVISVWLIATFSFVYSETFLNIANAWMVFIFAIPLSCVVLIVFNSIWGRRFYTFVIISVLLWSILLCTYLYYFQYQIWMIFVLGAPIQIAIILWSQLKKRS